MATLKEHQAAMVDLLANGSGIQASASRLAHALHDVLSMLTSEQLVEAADWRCLDATTPGLNDKALSKREKALKTDSHAKWPTPAEQRVKELENTIRQLKANLAHERACVAELRGFLESAKMTETKLRKEIYNIEQHRDAFRADLKRTDAYVADLISRLPEQAGCRREDTQMCDHSFEVINGTCVKCGVRYTDVCHQDKYK